MKAVAVAAQQEQQDRWCTNVRDQPRVGADEALSSGVCFTVLGGTARAHRTPAPYRQDFRLGDTGSLVGEKGSFVMRRDLEQVRSEQLKQDI